MGEKFKLKYIPHLLIDVLAYNFVEAALLVWIIYDGWGGDPLNQYVLWVFFLGMSFWIVSVATAAAESVAKELVLSRLVCLLEFAGAAILLISIAIVLRGEAWYFWTIFLLGAYQNARYTYLSYKWLREERQNNPNSTT